jgi:hypothetical protein
MPKYVPEEEYSWIWHPFYGVFLEYGYQRHRLLEMRHPEILTMPKVIGSDEVLVDYDPARGYIRVDEAAHRIVFVRYPLDNISAKERVPLAEVDKVFRVKYGFDDAYSSVMDRRIDWSLEDVN